MSWVYPRLGIAHAHVRLDEIRVAFESGGVHAVSPLAATDHPFKKPVATGGRIAEPSRLENLRAALMETMAPWLAGTDPVATISGDSARFDIVLGKALHKELEIIFSDAAHLDTWSFIGLVLLPDITVARWPSLNPDRVLGNRSKHAMQRLWIREHVLGDILDPNQPKPLGEDELFQLFDRTALSRNHRLVRILAATVQANSSTARSEWARELYKRVTFLTGARLLDVLDDQELSDLVAEEALSQPGGANGFIKPRPRLRVRLPSDPDEARFTDAVIDAWTREVDYNFPDNRFEIDLREHGAVTAATSLVDQAGNSEVLETAHPFEIAVASLIRDDRFASLFPVVVVDRARSLLDVGSQALE